MQPKIVLFDSGIGGITILREVVSLNPHLNFLYIADSLYLPYGDKSAEFIKNRCLQLTEFAIKQQASAVIMACNSATACALSYVRNIYPNLPILGVEPALKPAANLTKNGIIGVLATNATLKSKRFADLVERYASNHQIISCACTGLAEQIESGDLNSTKTKLMLQQFSAPLIQQNCDVIVLGCTHYPFITPLLRKIFPDNVQIIDTGIAVAKYLRSLFPVTKINTNHNKVHFMSSLNATELSELLPNLWKYDFICSDLPNL